MITVSLCMIVKNEEQVLARCLDCAQQIADEIIIVDTGSTDNTVAIARRYTDKVYFFDWKDDFAAARNFSFSKATKEYILWLDADDVIDEHNIQSFLQLKQTMPGEVDVAMFPYHVGFDEEGKVNFQYYRERLLRNSKGYIWMEPVHEYLVLSGNIQNFDVVIVHGDKERTHTTRNLEIYEGLLKQGVSLTSRGIYYYAKELRNHSRFDQAIGQYRAFLTLPGIWKEDAICAAQELSDCLVTQDQLEEALDVLFASFSKDLPRADVLCRVGEIYMQKEDYSKAIFWYSFALEVPRPDSWGFIMEDYWGFVPHLQLCVLYYKIGQLEKSIQHNQAAAQIKPNHPSVLHNLEFFSSVEQERPA